MNTDFVIESNEALFVGGPADGDIIDFGHHGVPDSYRAPERPKLVSIVDYDVSTPIHVHSYRRERFRSRDDGTRYIKEFNIMIHESLTQATAFQYLFQEYSRLKTREKINARQ